MGTDESTPNERYIEQYARRVLRRLLTEDLPDVMRATLILEIIDQGEVKELTLELVADGVERGH